MMSKLSHVSTTSKDYECNNWPDSWNYLQTMIVGIICNYQN